MTLILSSQSSRHENAVDARARKEAHIQQSIDMAHQRGDDKTAKAKQKKLERAAFTDSLDGHKFKLMSMKKLVRESVAVMR